MKAKLKELIAERYPKTHCFKEECWDNADEFRQAVFACKTFEEVAAHPKGLAIDCRITHTVSGIMTTSKRRIRAVSNKIWRKAKQSCNRRRLSLSGFNPHVP